MQEWFDVKAPIGEIGRIRERCETEYTGREVVVCPFQGTTLVRCASEEIADRVRRWVEPSAAPAAAHGPVPDEPTPTRRRRVRAA